MINQKVAHPFFKICYPFPESFFQRQSNENIGNDKIKICSSIKGKAILKIRSTFFTVTHVLSVSFKMEPL